MRDSEYSSVQGLSPKFFWVGRKKVTSTMEFERRKAATLASMNSPEPDKSPKGNIDIPIIPLLTILNSHPSYFTTSSCSGRISIFSQPINPTPPPTSNKKAKGGTWVFISHDPVEPASVIPLLFPSPSSESQNHEEFAAGPHSLVFKFEPLIIAVECIDVDAAQSLVALAISCGFRESGITSVSKRVIIAIRCSIRLEVPLGNTEKIVVSSEYLKYLIGVANEKMETNRKRTDLFHEALMRNGFSRHKTNSLENRIGDGEVGCDEDSECPNGAKMDSLENYLSADDEDDDMVGEREDLDDSHSGNLLLQLSLFDILLYIFGGCDGEKAVGDLYAFNVQTCKWEKLNMAGRKPVAKAFALYSRIQHLMNWLI